MAWTNKGAFRLAEIALANGTEPTDLYWALVTSATAPTVDTNTLSQLTQIATGNGYTDGGLQKARNSTNFPVVENDTDDRFDTDPPDLVWTASGGPIPSSGSGARYLVLTDDNVTVGSREVWAFFDLSADRSVSSGQSLTLQNPLLRGTTV